MCVAFFFFLAELLHSPFSIDVVHPPVSSLLFMLLRPQRHTFSPFSPMSAVFLLFFCVSALFQTYEYKQQLLWFTWSRTRVNIEKLRVQGLFSSYVCVRTWVNGDFKTIVELFI